jgi:alpha-L-rhamnosidase
VKAIALAGAVPSVLLAISLPRALSPSVAADARSPLTPVELRADGMVDPLGVDSAPPRLSWQLQGDTSRGLRQSAWQVLVSSSADRLKSGSGDVWDSGRVESNGQLHRPYEGRPLGVAEPVFWKVRVWDGEGRVSAWSAPARWTMSALAESGRRGQWITDPGLLRWVTERPPAPGTNPRANDTLLLRRDFDVRGGLRRALASVCGLGQYEMTLNGTRVGDRLLTPGWTAYEKTCLYDTYDVTALLKPGANAVGLMLAGGMYNVQPGRYTKFVSAFRPLVAIGEMRLEYGDATAEVVGTDREWRVASGPITFSNVYGGEDHDARRELPGWDRPGFDAASWTAAVVTDGPGCVLRGASHASPPFRAYESLVRGQPVELRPGVAVYDSGQNAAMMPRLRVRGPAGASVTLVPAELLNADGSVDRRSVGGGEAYWSYTLAGRPEGETWFPRFFYHGGRYLQVERRAPAGGALPVVERLQSVVVHSDSPPAGQFASSSDLFNRIRTLVRWAQRSNLAHVITDCPHRERLGWLEQYHLNGPSLRYETDLTRLFAKTFADMADAQQPSGLVPDIAPEYVVFEDGFRDSPEWGSAIILAAWQHYVWTGDDTPLRRNYDAMKRYVAYLASRAEGDVVSHGLGDWYDIGPKPPGVSQLTPIALTATAIYGEDLQTLSRIAGRLGHEADATQYRAAADRIQAAFNRRFFDAATGIYATGSQTAQAMPLVLGLVPDEHRARVLDALVRDIRSQGNATTAGDVGYRYVLRALAGGGRSDVIYDMNHQTERPGYGFQLGVAPRP